MLPRGEVERLGGPLKTEGLPSIRTGTESTLVSPSIEGLVLVCPDSGDGEFPKRGTDVLAAVGFGVFASEGHTKPGLDKSTMEVVFELVSAFFATGWSSLGSGKSSP
jgi:hypothetical protein